jgi:hypothetical protein
MLRGLCRIVCTHSLRKLAESKRKHVSDINTEGRMILKSMLSGVGRFIFESHFSVLPIRGCVFMTTNS